MESIQIIEKYFAGLTEIQKRQFGALYNLYSEWNERINLISRKDIEHLYERHVLHSLSISKVFEFIKKTEILDIGTGGGFPGIPLAILFPEVNFTLVDSIGKKINVVKEIALALNLKNVEALHSRAEDVNGPFDFVVSRATASIEQLLKWTAGNYKTRNTHRFSNGLICLKGGDLTEELSMFKAKAKVFEIGSFFNEDFFKTKKIIYIPEK